MTAGRKSISETKDWCTPPGIVRSVKEVFGGKIGLDPCSNEWSLVNAEVEFRLPEKDGLRERWEAESIYVNPPYGSDRERGTRIIDWFRKIGEAVDRGAEVIALVPVATNTRHWKEFVYPKAQAICFLSAPRLRFFMNGEEDPKGAPMSCAVIYYGTDWAKFADSFKTHGAVVPLTQIVLPGDDRAEKLLQLF